MGPDGQHAQYMFGESIIVAPICAAASATTGMAMKEIWLPPGSWYDNVFGFVHKSTDMMINQEYALEEVPMFMKAGAIIPRIPNPEKIGIATERYEALDVYVYPGEQHGEYTLYEDDGMTYGYLDNKWVTTQMSYQRSGDSISFTVTAINNTHSWLPSSRRWRFFFVGMTPATSVQIDGTDIHYGRFTSAGQFGYDGKSATVIVDGGSLPIANSHTILCTFASGGSSGEHHSVVARAKGYAQRARLAKRLLDDVRETPSSNTVGPGLLKQAGAHAVELTYLAGTNITAFMENVGTAYTTLMKEALTEIGGSPSPAPSHSRLTQLYDADRHDMLLCGSQDCLNTNYQYQVLWTEGYQPASTSSDAETLYDYYSSSYKDNYATTASNPPPGYSAAVFSNGYVYSSSGTTRSCLDVFFSPATNDHLTTAVEQGRKYAQDNGYVKSHDCIAYVESTPPEFFNMTAGELLKKIVGQGSSFHTQAQALLASVIPPQ